MEANKCGVLDRLLQDLAKGESLSEEDACWVLEHVAFSHQSRDDLEKLPNCLSLHAPITVCGDIRGQFEDLEEIFLRCGELPVELAESVHELPVPRQRDRRRRRLEQVLAVPVAAQAQTP